MPAESKQLVYRDAHVGEARKRETGADAGNWQDVHEERKLGKRDQPVRPKAC